jgi:serine/threonine protein kinase
LNANATPEQKADAAQARISFIKQQITKFTKLSASLNVARLEQVYEDSTNVYLVIEKLNGPSVEELISDGRLPENDVKHIMRSVVRVLAQCHDAGFEHGAVDPSKFRLLSEDRRSPVKATGFGPLNSPGAKGMHEHLIFIRQVL